MNLDIFLTTDCNMTCKFCGAWKQDQKAKYLDKEDVFKTLEDGKKYGFKFTTLSGGEPLLHPDLKEIIEFADFLGYWINITTNGLLVNQEFINAIKNKKVNIRVSCHTLNKEKHKEITGDNTFDKVMESIYLLKSNNKYYSIGFTTFDENISEMTEIARFALENNAAFIRFTPVARVFKGKEFNLQVGFYEKMLKNIVDLCIKYKKYLKYEKSGNKINSNFLDIMTTRQCPAGSDLFMIIDANKDIIPCQFIPKELNYWEKDYKSIEDFTKVKNNLKKAFQEAKDKGFTGECKKCAFVNVCLGSCLANKLPDGLQINDEQPVCIKKALKNVLMGYSESEVEELLNYWFYHFNQRVSNKDKNKACMRKLPIWELNFRYDVAR